MTKQGSGLSWKDKVLIKRLSFHAGKRMTIDQICDDYKEHVGGCPNRASMLNNMARLVDIGFVTRVNQNGSRKVATYDICTNPADFDA